MKSTPQLQQYNDASTTTHYKHCGKNTEYTTNGMNVRGTTVNVHGGNISNIHHHYHITPEPAHIPHTRYPVKIDMPNAGSFFDALIDLMTVVKGATNPIALHLSHRCSETIEMLGKLMDWAWYHAVAYNQSGAAQQWQIERMQSVRCPQTTLSLTLCF